MGIGETGLDFYYEHSPRDEQVESFRAHIAASRQTGLPLIVHTRDADRETIDILEEEAGKGAFPGLIHCFSPGAEVARRALALGFYISISGIVTFKAAEALRGIVRDIPLDRLLVETDSPYLAPVPKRGKTNEPAYVAHTAAKVAELKGVSVGELEAATTSQFLPALRQGGAPAVRVTILGCGTSAGVPRPGGKDGLGEWGAANPEDDRNRRRRCSILVQDKGKTAPRRHLARSASAAARRPGRTRRRGDLWTHEHADQVHGIDDLRPYALRQGRIEAWADSHTSAILRRRFGYCFEAEGNGFYNPIYQPNLIEGPVQRRRPAGDPLRPGPRLDARRWAFASGGSPMPMMS